MHSKQVVNIFSMNSQNNYKFNKKFWNNQKVLITGSKGFVGQNLVKKLLKIKKQVKIKILTPSRQELNLINPNNVQKYFERNKPTLVLHLAGKVGGIGINRVQQGVFFYENLLMGAHVMHYSKMFNVKKVVSLAAGCGYPVNSIIPMKESDFWSGLPDKNSIGYSMAKKNLIIQSWVYKEQFNFNSTVLLPANLYGPYDNFNLKTSHVVPALIKKFIHAKKNNKKSVNVWGDGSASREFLFVDDLCFIILEAAERIKSCGPFNVGTGKETTILKLVNIIKFILDINPKVIWQKKMPNGQVRRNYDMKNFKKNFKFRKFSTLQYGLKETIDWYTKNEKFLDK